MSRVNISDVAKCVASFSLTYDEYQKQIDMLNLQIHMLQLKQQELETYMNVLMQVGAEL